MKRTALLAAAICLLVTGLYASTSLAGDNPPGRDPCSHGATGKPCRPDPQPGHGKDCDHHGKNGGVNEDHCTGTTTGTTTETRPGTTTPTPGATTPGSTTTVTVIQPTPGPTKTVIKVKQHKVIVIKKVHVLITTHVKPKTTG